MTLLDKDLSEYFIETNEWEIANQLCKVLEVYHYLIDYNWSINFLIN